MTVEVKKIRTTWVADDIKNMFALFFFCFCFWYDNN